MSIDRCASPLLADTDFMISFTFEIPGALKMFPMTGSLLKKPMITGKKSLNNEEKEEPQSPSFSAAVDRWGKAPSPKIERAVVSSYF